MAKYVAVYGRWEMWVGNHKDGYVTGWVNQSGHVTGHVCMVAMQWLQNNGKEMVRYWLDQETGYVLVMHRHFCLMYLVMYDKFANFGRM